MQGDPSNWTIAGNMCTIASVLCVHYRRFKFGIVLGGMAVVLTCTALAMRFRWI